MSSKSGGAKRKKGHGSSLKVIADNRRARYDYELLSFFEAGLVLKGSEVKSLRQMHASIAESYAYMRQGEVFLSNAHIPEYKQAALIDVYNPRRVRKLLLHGKEIKKIEKALTEKGMTLVPLKLFFSSKGLAKLELALAKGKKLYDKREAEKKRDWSREKAKLMKQNC